jgi:hypothetical protein
MTIKKKIVIAISLVILLLGNYFMYVEHYSRSVLGDLKALQGNELALFDAAWQIRWLDEALTASAARYVQSKADPAWQKRYDAHVGMLDVAIASATAKANPSDLRHFTAVDESMPRRASTTRRMQFFKVSMVFRKPFTKRVSTTFFSSQKARLDSTMSERVQQANTNRAVAMGMLTAIAAFIGFMGLLLVRTVIARITKLSAITGRLAQGEVDGLSIDVGGNDEISRLAEGMRGVAAAIEMLTSEAEARLPIAAQPDEKTNAAAKVAE